MKIKNLFREKVEKDVVSLIDMYEEKTIKRIIELLKEKPKTFSANWSSSKEFLDGSVRSRNGKILISLDGQVLTPTISHRINDKYTDEIIKLIKPIVKRDLEILMETFDSE
jgi:hypothetical protein